MVLRLLFGLTTSLVSGLAVAILLSAVVGRFFSDPADPQSKLSIVEAHRDARSANGKPTTGPTGSDTAPLVLFVRVPETGSEAGLHPAAQRDPAAILPAEHPPAGEPRQLQPTVLTQAPSPDGKELPSSSAIAGLPDENHHQPASLQATPDPPAQPVSLAGVAQARGQISAQEDTPEPAPISEQNAQPVHPKSAKPPEARDARAHVAAGRSTRARPAHALHADHARRGHASSRGTTAIAQHPAQM